MRSIFISIFLTFLVCASVQSLEVGDYSSASANEWVDNMLTHLRPLVIEKNGDPLSVPDMYLTFNYTFLFTDHTGEMNLTRPMAIGMSTLHRYGECGLNYDLQILRLSLSLIVKELLLDSKYSMHVLGMEPSGNIFAHITDQIINIDILIDVRESTVSLQHFEMPNEGKLKISIDGLGILGDALAGVILAVVDNLFKTTVIGAVESEIEQLLVSILDSIHYLPPIPDPSPPPFDFNLIGLFN